MKRDELLGRAAADLPAGAAGFRVTENEFFEMPRGEVWIGREVERPSDAIAPKLSIAPLR
jgi:hypothetical protein